METETRNSKKIWEKFYEAAQKMRTGFGLVLHQPQTGNEVIDGEDRRCRKIWKERSTFYKTQ